MYKSGAPSDHRVSFVKAELPKIRSFEWFSYSYRYYNEKSEKKFGSWLAGFDWAEMVSLRGSNNKAEYYQARVMEALEEFFPLFTVRKRSMDCPWVNKRILKMIRNRKEIYQREGRSANWRRVRKVVEDMILRRKKYLQSQKDCLLVEDARRNFFRNIKALQSKDKPRPCDVRTLSPDMTDTEVANKLATYFNQISSEFQPLEPSDIPTI